MDAGVPILKPVAGISVGMMSYPHGSTVKDEYVLLTDIIGLEDFSGDMDFKVAGTDTGITAIQLDVKIPGLTIKQIEEILERARVARMSILEKMVSVISEPRDAVSEYAPKIEMLRIPVEKIGELIGPGGKIIKNIIAMSGAQVDVEDDGFVTISGINPDQVQKALVMVEGITKDVNPGEVYEGEVKRILPFGASIVLADEVSNLDYGKLLANYGEFSGNPSAEESYLYTKNVLKLLLKSSADKKVLIIAGGVANFTDVRITFNGLIKALTEMSGYLQKQKIKVFVRRGGPHQNEGLEAMRAFLEKEQLLGVVAGPEMVLTNIVTEAITELKVK